MHDGLLLVICMWRHLGIISVIDYVIFLLEFHMGKIIFEPTFTPIPTKNEIMFNLQCSNFINLDISPVDIPFEQENETEEIVYFDMGKSFTFLFKPRILLNEFKSNPLEITLLVNENVEGTNTFFWREEFIETVKLLETIRMVKAVDYSGKVELRNESDEPIGKVELFLRMSCFGDCVETQFQVREVNEEYEYIFKNTKTTITYKCESSSDAEILPVASLYVPATRASDIPEGTPHELWEALAGEAINDPLIQQGEGIALSNLFGGSADTVSIYMCIRPSEHKFYDLLNLMTAEVSTNEQGTSVLFTRDKPAIHKKQDSGGVLVEREDFLELTADKIAKKLCTNKDCPAAKKFKKFGIGPLATGKGLGTLYNDVDPPVEYGMSQTYGTMSNYGPFGVFAMPKRPAEPTVDTENSIENTTPPAPNPADNCKVKSENQCPYNLRLRGGGPLTDESDGPKSPIQECKAVMDQMDEILRAYKKALGPCGESTCPFAQNLAEESCKKLCENALSSPQEIDDTPSCKSIPCSTVECPFRETTTKYPAGCGSPKCAYTKYKLGLADDDAALELQFLPPAVSGKCGHPKCKYLLQPDLPPIHWDCPEPLPKGNCKNPNCPFQPPDLRKLKIPKPKKGPCGSTSCPYAIPPPCDAPTCPFRVVQCPLKDQNQEKTEKKPCCQQEPEEPDDCGDPECCESKLKGEFTACGNQDCPFSSKMSPKVDSNPCGKSTQKITNVCDNPECPFSSKPKDTHTCGNPACPSSKRKETNSYECGDPSCPFISKQKNTNTNCPFTSKPKNSNLCGSPDCPFAPKPKNEHSCGDPNCPFLSKQKKSDVCDNPDCPFASKPKKDTNSCGDPNCPFGSKQKNSDVCNNPDCPFASKPKKDTNSCGDPNCPFGSNKEKSDVCDNPDCPFTSRSTHNGVCDNPDCPFASKPKHSGVCDNPDCPFASKSKEFNTCENPDCPFAEKKQKDVCDNPDCPFAEKKQNDVCNNPDCPFAEKKQNGVCDNPDCPFAEKKQKDICDNPDCPFAEKKQKGVCDNPNCPYAEKKQKDVCDDPDCPFAEKKQKDVCDNPDCPYQQKQQKSICDDPFCPYIQPLPSCGRPNCPYEPVPTVFCPAKIAEYQRKQIDAARQYLEKRLEPETVQQHIDYDCQTNEFHHERRNSKRKSIDKRRSIDSPKSNGVKKNGEMGDSGEKGNGGAKGNNNERLMDSGATKDNPAIKGNGGGKRPPKRNKETMDKTSKSRRRKKRGKFVYSTGDKYPGVKVGHKECVTPYFHVPAKMGWLWNVYQPRLWLKPRKGWKPGAIQRTLAARIKAHRQAKGLGMPNIPSFKNKRRGGDDDDDEDVKVSPKPTLQIQKKEGAYWITMNPLKDPYSLEENENPYMDCTPMQFKITKNKNRKKKDDDEENESRLCYCEEDLESSSSDSELDIEFTPPAGIIHPERFKKKQNVIHCDTQYDPKDFTVKKKGKDAGKGKGGKGGKAGKGKDKGKDKGKTPGSKKGKK